MKPKDELFRVVKKDGNIFLDDSMKADGRGAYICKNKDCIAKANKIKSFNRNFKSNVNNDIYLKLLERVDDK
jgi:uncharacterized protein